MPITFLLIVFGKITFLEIFNKEQYNLLNTGKHFQTLFVRVTHELI